MVRKFFKQKRNDLPLGLCICVWACVYAVIGGESGGEKPWKASAKPGKVSHWQHMKFNFELRSTALFQSHFLAAVCSYSHGLWFKVTWHLALLAKPEDCSDGFSYSKLSYRDALPVFYLLGSTVAPFEPYNMTAQATLVSAPIVIMATQQTHT